MRRIVCCCIVLALAACAPVTRRPSINPALTAKESNIQREMVVRDLVNKERRLASVDYRLRIANAPLCGDHVQPALGMVVSCPEDIDPAWEAAYSRVLGSGDRLVILAVADGSPAASAGLEPGDVVTAINGQAAPTGKGAMAWYARTMNQALGSRSVDMVIMHAGVARRSLRVTAVDACAFPAELMSSDQINAFADGRRIVVYTGMLDFCQTDDELALILGHELAHDSMGHIEAKKGNAAIGGIFGAILAGFTGVNLSGVFAQAGSQAYSQEFEAEADYVGMYYAARAGFDIDHSADVWRRMAVKHPEAITHGTTHPPTAERFAALEATVREIRDKQTQGQPLAPEMQQQADKGK